jgi:putative selenate reductase molybdopterin-binding subunit
VQVAAEDARAKLLEFAAQVWDCAASDCHIEPGAVVGPEGRREALAVLARQSIYGFGVKRQIMGVGSRVTFEAPPPFSAQFAEVEVDCETGHIYPLHLVCAVDCGVAINPQMAEGQIEGGVTQALGYALCEDMPLAPDGRLLVESLRDYHIFQADEMPVLTSILVSSFEPSGPFGAKAVAEIPLSGVAPAIANAVYDACGVRLREIPMTPERVLAALDALERDTSSR